jgi:hypothetical protein
MTTTSSISVKPAAAVFLVIPLNPLSELGRAGRKFAIGFVAEGL